MTATTTRPTPGTVPPTPSSAPTPSAAAPPAREPDPTAGATLALTLLTLAAALGMGRLFSGGDFAFPFAVVALGAHWLAWATRRAGLTLASALPVSLLGVAVLLAWTLFPHTTAYGMPWAGTWEAITTALHEAWTAFATVVAPAPPTKGFLAAGMVGIGVAALLADWAAFRVRAAFEAGIPAFTLFLFTAVLGTPERRSLHVVAFLLALLLFVLVHQAGAVGESASWFASRSRGGLGALLQGGALLAAVAVVAAVFVGPVLPGSSSEPVLDWRQGDGAGNGSRTTVSPLVDIRGRLVNQSSAELFTVEASAPSYWRLTSLDTFDGDIWQSNDSYRPTDESLPGGVPVRAAKDEVVQKFTIGSLASIWLPAAYRPQRIEDIENISFNADTGSVITRTDTTDGYTYRVVSAVPRPTSEELRQAGPPLTDEDLARYLRLPPVPGRVAQLAADLTADAPTAYDKARALQDWFRANFTYDIEARAGHDGRALERFLFQARRGYCEQFAGAFAVLARIAGLPTRVAVGFTQGERDTAGVYHVRGLNAHAWPEVYIQGYGWVYFEPTPNRGMPGTEGWTNVPAQQAPPGDPNVGTTLPPTTSPPTPETPTTQPGSGGNAVPGGGTDDGSLLESPVVRFLLFVVVVAGLWAVAVPTARRVHRRRRRDAARDGRDRVLVAWQEAEEALGQAGMPRLPAETTTELAARAARVRSLPSPAADALRELSRDVAAASFGPDGVAGEVVRRAVAAAAAVEEALAAQADWRARVRQLFDPRPLFAGRRRQRVVARAHPTEGRATA
jgi:transglutaminase-like putative cysteine protease